MVLNSSGTVDAYEGYCVEGLVTVRARDLRRGQDSRLTAFCIAVYSRSLGLRVRVREMRLGRVIAFFAGYQKGSNDGSADSKIVMHRLMLRYLTCEQEDRMCGKSDVNGTRNVKFWSWVYGKASSRVNAREGVREKYCIFNDFR